jgi:isocitrate dehydrogenase kinase/phosphatase
MSTAQLADVLLDSYEAYVQEFHAITRRARGCFEGQDWTGSVQDSLARLRLYKGHIDAAVARCRTLFPAEARRAELWEDAKAICRDAVADRYDADLAVMFLDSVLRASAPDTLVPYGAHSVDPKCDPEIQRRIVRTYEVEPQHPWREAVERILRDCEFLPPYRDLREDAAGAAQVIEDGLPGALFDARIEMLRPLFYRNKGAYAVGRIRAGGAVRPLAFALAHTREGIVVDAVLTEEGDLRRIFSYTRSNFHVELEGQYRELLDFLRSLMPHKNQAALYSSIGFMNPAKIQLSKDLDAHRRTGRPMTAAWGIPGLVMVVFTPPGFPYVFKVIRDDDKVTKSRYIGRQGVRDKYRLVQEGDRVGRLLDTITFHHLRFARHDFEPKILRELMEACSATVKVAGDDVFIAHCYAQRETTPLPIYLRQCDWPETQRVLNDLGWCLKDIAAAGLFTGEFDLKNFGVAEDGRVVFFDFDGLDMLGKFSFDDVPLETSLGQEEVFEYLLHEYRVSLVDVFRGLHPDLFTARYWKDIQARIKQGEVLDTFPYPPHKRLANRRRVRFPPAVDEALDRFGLKSVHRRGLIAWESLGAGMTVGRSPWLNLSEAQRLAVQQAFGIDDGAFGSKVLGVVLVDGVPGFVYVPGLPGRVIDLLGHYPLARHVAAEWRERARREVFDRGLAPQEAASRPDRGPASPS